MILIYEKGTNKYIGAIPKIFENGVWREATVEEIYPNTDISNWGFLEVSDSPRYWMADGGYMFRTDKKGVPVGVMLKPWIKLSIDAEDTDGDGLPEVKPGEKTKVKVAIELDKDDKQHAKAKFSLILSATGGALQKRRIELTPSKPAQVNFTAPTDTIAIALSAKGAPDVEVKEGRLEIEGMPD